MWSGRWEGLERKVPWPMDRKEIWKPKGKRKLAWSAWENLETHSFYDPIAFPDHNLEPLVITCWFQRLMVQDSTAITGYAIYRGFRLAFPFPVLFIWPGDLPGQDYQQTRKNIVPVLGMSRPGGSYVLVHKLIEAFWEPFGPGHEDYQKLTLGNRNLGRWKL